MDQYLQADAELSETPYPVPCRFCDQFLYGPVDYCPYCGRQLARSGQEYPKGLPKELPKEPFKILSNWAYVLLVTVVIGVFGYLVFRSKEYPANNPPVAPPSSSPEQKQPPPPPVTPNHAQREAARLVGLEALHLGTMLAATLNNLPKVEKVVQNAKRLQAISPRYQQQVTKAESILRDAHYKRDKYLLAYIGKALIIGRYSPETISFALQSIQNGDLTPRERMVSDLLVKHLRSLREQEPNPTQWLADFTHSFNDFVD